MISCLGRMALKLSNQPSAKCQTCVNKAKSQRGAVMQTSWWINSSFCCLPCFPPSSLLFLPPCCCNYGWIQVIKHRLQRLLRPQKEENKNKQPTSTVATVGLEEMKAKVEHLLYRNKWHSHSFPCQVDNFPRSTITTLENIAGIIERKANYYFSAPKIMKSIMFLISFPSSSELYFTTSFYSSFFLNISPLVWHQAASHFHATN